jgi:energy-coupling factor transport system substrate-specific component
MPTGLSTEPEYRSPLSSRTRNSPLPRLKEFDAGLIAFGAALNVSIGYLTGLLKLPLYLDSIGTILISVLCGPLYGIIVGLSALIILALTAVPTVIAYAGTALVIALLASFMARFGFLKSFRVTIIGGLLLGVAAAAASAPVTTFLYGGVSLAGADAITTFLRASGMSLWKSALLGSLITDSLDKIITALICYGLLRSLPPRILEKIHIAQSPKSKN